MRRVGIFLLLAGAKAFVPNIGAGAKKILHCYILLRSHEDIRRNSVDPFELTQIFPGYNGHRYCDGMCCDFKLCDDSPAHVLPHSRRDVNLSTTYSTRRHSFVYRNRTASVTW